MDATLFVQAGCELGESPMWHAERNSIWWADIEAGKFFECSLLTKKIKSWQVPQRLGLLVQCAGDSNILLLAVADGLLQFNITTGEFKRVLFLEEKVDNNRCNDGACDAKGRLWLGTMDINCTAGAGKLYCINSDLQVQVKIEPTDISNGICWSVLQDRMYYIDSTTYQVKSYFFDVGTSEIIFDKTVINIPPQMGMPDGMAIDEEGMLWIANWGGFAVNQWNPATGEMMETIVLPVPNVTSCVFGGLKMDRMFITTARAGLSSADLERYPLSGSIFTASPRVKGCNKHKCSI